MNMELFKYFVAKRGYKLTEIAEMLGVNPSTLTRKMNGDTDFTRGEIVTLRQGLSLSLNEVEAIFFDEKLA